eukprot:UN2846
MYYALPQGRGKGIPSSLAFVGDVQLAGRYSEEFVKFASGNAPVWEQYNVQSKPITFYDKKGPYVVHGYRNDQCKILDSSMGQVWPDAHKNRMFTSPLPPLRATTTDKPQMSLGKKTGVKAHKA